MTHCYRVTGAVVRTEHVLGTVPCSAPCDEAPSGEVEIRLRIAVGTPRPWPEGSAEARPRPDGQDPDADEKDDALGGLSVVREASGGYVLRLDHADFCVDPRARTIDVIVSDSGAWPSLEPLFLDQILPRVLHGLGRFSLHASAVAVGDREAIVFVGDSGAGKSTLAASLARARPFGFFADDCVAFRARAEDVVAFPGYPSARLWPPSASSLFAERGDLPRVSDATDKRRVAFAAGPRLLPLRRIYLLEPSAGAPAITPLRRARALAALVAHVYRLDLRDRRILGDELGALTHLAGCVVARRLAYRRAYDQLAAVRHVIEGDLRGPAPIEGPERHT